MADKIEAGDWVRFLRDNKLVIGVVQYRQERKAWQNSAVLVTDVGEVDEDRILESRRGVR